MVTPSIRPASPRARASTGPVPSKRDERRARQQELARTQLLDAAEEVLGEKGIYVATIKEIADRAEYSVGSVYSFFESKDELLVAVMARRGVEMSAGIVAATRREGPPLERLTELARYEVEYFRARPAFARLYLRSSSIGSLLPDSPHARDAVHRRALARRPTCRRGLRGRSHSARATLQRTGERVPGARCRRSLVCQHVRDRRVLHARVAHVRRHIRSSIMSRTRLAKGTTCRSTI
jgi:AcrR family transcriptional regulator